MMDAIRKVIESIREPIAIIGLIAIALMHPIDTVTSGVIGALAGIIVGGKAGK